MKKVILGGAVAVFIVAACIFALGQRGGDKRGGGFGGHFGKAGLFLRGLDLTDEQKEKVKTILEANRQTFEPLKEQAKANRTRLMELRKSGQFDQDQVEAIATEQGSLTAKMIVERERVRAEVFAILTDEQKAKAAEMQTNFEERGKRRHKRHAPDAEQF